ncbi:MAG: nitrilase-related carbon-nitrogen hydrolase [Deltaproteobacteria bacterium]|nr:nitrilase-related carbon-nitrogen hydrolase [Deltaproteobacteria bacterium]MDZ4342033.1 nitrilase-related carbon-nitrogen hydrolase [Candidatus Binatia bacterium]
MVPRTLRRLNHSAAELSLFALADQSILSLKFGQPREQLGTPLHPENVAGNLLPRGIGHKGLAPKTEQRFRATIGIEIRTRNYAFEGRCFVISSTGVFSDEMRELLCTTPEQKSKHADTGAFSSIIGPAGDYLAGPDRSGEKILYADIDPAVIIDEKISHDLTGHYNRFDLFTLLVDDRPVQRGPVFQAREEEEAVLRSADRAEPVNSPETSKLTNPKPANPTRRKP